MLTPFYFNRFEVGIFSAWLEDSRHTLDLEDKDRAHFDPNHLTSRSQVDAVREFAKEVIAHEGNLLSISVAAGKFVDESKDYLDALHEFCITLPDPEQHQHIHIESISNADSQIQKEIEMISTKYENLLLRANNASGSLTGVGEREFEYRDALDKASNWFNSIHPRVSAMPSNLAATDRQSVQDQMNDAKILHNEFLEKEGSSKIRNKLWIHCSNRSPDNRAHRECPGPLQKSRLNN